MYLSRVTLSLSRVDAIAFASSPYRIHAAVEQAFPPQAARTTDRGRILWRLDEVPGAVDEAWLLWQFRLKANPARKVFVDKGTRAREGVVGTIQGHVTEAQQRSWLLDRAEAHGFRIAQTEEGFDRLVVSHRKREVFKRQEGVVTLTTAQFDGVLEVTDAEAFRHVLGFGLGRARGFGCGLMTIAPAGESCHA